jgi:hypothetical protein
MWRTLPQGTSSGSRRELTPGAEYCTTFGQRKVRHCFRW